jgi:molybdopterin synthase sulfur carrier subunit
MMKIELLFFGQLTDITGTTVVMLDHMPNTDTLKHHVFEMYPSLQQAKLMIAVNNKLVTENVVIPDGAKIAFMPPYSGG